MGQPAFSSSLFDLADPFCSARDRMKFARDHQRVRANFFVSLRSLVSAFSPTALEAYDAEAGEPITGFGMHSAREYMRRLVIAGAIVRGPENVIAGMHTLHRHSMYRFIGSPFVRRVLNLVNFTPHVWCEFQRHTAFRHLAVNYGTMEYKRLGPRSLVVHFEDEPVFPEITMVGMSFGLLDLCGLHGRVMAEPHGPTALTMWIQWD